MRPVGSAPFGRSPCFSLSQAARTTGDFGWLTGPSSFCKTMFSSVIQLDYKQTGRNWHYITKALAVKTRDLIRDFKIVKCRKKLPVSVRVYVSTGLWISGEQNWLLKASPEMTETLGKSGPLLTSQFRFCHCSQRHLFWILLGASQGPKRLAWGYVSLSPFFLYLFDNCEPVTGSLGSCRSLKLNPCL